MKCPAPCWNCWCWSLRSWVFPWLGDGGGAQDVGERKRISWKPLCQTCWSRVLVSPLSDAQKCSTTGVSLESCPCSRDFTTPLGRGCLAKGCERKAHILGFGCGVMSTRVFSRLTLSELTSRWEELSWLCQGFSCRGSDEITSVRVVFSLSEAFHSLLSPQN